MLVYLQGDAGKDYYTVLKTVEMLYALHVYLRVHKVEMLAIHVILVWYTGIGY